MNSNKGLKGIEKRSYGIQFEDGLMDLMLGFTLFVVGLGTFLERMEWGNETIQLAIYSVLITIGIVSLVIAKKRITERRIGKARFSIRRKRRHLLAVLVLWASVVLGMFMAYIGGRIVFDNTPFDDLLTRWGITAIMSVKIILVFSLLAYILQLDRLHLYGVLYMLSLTGSIFLSRWIGSEWITPILIAGCSVIILWMGTIVLVRFLKKYPSPLKERGVIT